MEVKKPSTGAWLIIHVVFPLCPFLIEGGIRFVVFNNDLSLATFSSTTLAISSGLICLFVSQSLFSYKPIIPSDDEQERAIGTAHYFNILGIVCFVAFGVLVLLTALSESIPPIDVKNIKSTFDLIVLIGASVPVISSFFTQRSYKLKAVI
ncbi:hypothetical protein JWV26_17350 [Ectopseudomonas toyotomiensis]|uniref:Uncharacterized protein n=1 Tax=Ectopseudomonas toyotomiensis TaxID=554344 RepID=A0ABD7DWY3_9GAMM|nr:hypothetical protein [Pseudomonas toyotomiensis]QSL91520.1 hypothetical protein JWV26_17350 [Pseudomonas toyotomiensis]